MIDWTTYIEVISEGADNPVTVNYDVELVILNLHPSQALQVTFKTIFTTGESIETKVIRPQQRLWVCTISGGPAFDNCQDVKIMSVIPTQ